MSTETVFTTVIPIIMLVCLVGYNLRKMQKNLKNMKNECSGSCKGCAHSVSCSKPEKKEDE
ncbi:MAG: FeoB-associated Cys-rich membrane protein [Anaerotignum sp.]|nr:FeoB-associated Cys-rich membrane protein [Anaerotignum sp.]